MDGIWQRANPQLRDLAVYEPGKPIEETAREVGLRPEKIVKLASNENPLGPSAKVCEAVRQALESANFYPDGGGYYLREALAAHLQVASECIILGNGSNEIIEFIGHAFLAPSSEMVTSENAFVAYRLAASLFGARTIAVPDQNYRFDLDGILDAINDRTRVIFIANPNNPTGTMVTQEAIEDFMTRVPGDVVIVFDEAYFEYLDNPPDVLKFVRQERDLIVLRTFSKIHALANLRVGYGIARPELIRVLHKARAPFNTSGLAQAAAIAALSDQVHQSETKRLTDEGRELFRARVCRPRTAIRSQRGEFRSRSRWRRPDHLRNDVAQGSDRPGARGLQFARMGADLDRNDGAKSAVHRRPSRRLAGADLR